MHILSRSSSRASASRPRPQSRRPSNCSEVRMYAFYMRGFDATGDERTTALENKADGGIRTLDPRFTRAVLWPTELRRRCGDECSPRSALLCVRLVVAESRWQRFRGLAWRRRPPDGWALLFPRCRSVHTFGMRFPIDVVFLNRWGWPVEIRRAVRPRRVVGCRDGAAVIEMAAGAADRHFVVVE